MKTRLHFVPTASLWLAPGFCRAATPTASPPELGIGLLQMLLALAVVVGLILVSLWLLKRLSTPRGAAGNLLRVVGATAVGPRERVVLVEIDDTWLVLGVASGQVNALHQMARRPDATVIPRSETPTADFRAWLRKATERNRVPR